MQYLLTRVTWLELSAELPMKWTKTKWSGCACSYLETQFATRADLPDPDSPTRTCFGTDRCLSVNCFNIPHCCYKSVMYDAHRGWNSLFKSIHWLWITDVVIEEGIARLFSGIYNHWQSIFKRCIRKPKKCENGFYLYFEMCLIRIKSKTPIFQWVNDNISHISCVDLLLRVACVFLQTYSEPHVQVACMN